MAEVDVKLYKLTNVVTAGSTHAAQTKYLIC